VCVPKDCYQQQRSLDRDFRLEFVTCVSLNSHYLAVDISGMHAMLTLLEASTTRAVDLATARGQLWFL
jgi:hypothetical protein